MHACICLLQLQLHIHYNYARLKIFVTYCSKLYDVMTQVFDARGTMDPSLPPPPNQRKVRVGAQTTTHGCMPSVNCLTVQCVILSAGGMLHKYNGQCVCFDTSPLPQMKPVCMNITLWCGYTTHWTSASVLTCDMHTDNTAIYICQ